MFDRTARRSVANRTANPCSRLVLALVMATVSAVIVSACERSEDDLLVESNGRFFDTGIDGLPTDSNDEKVEQGRDGSGSADDPNEVVILFEWDTLENARSFAESQETREAMKRGGLTGPLELGFLEEVERTSS